jgi:hypothetical protein
MLDWSGDQKQLGVFRQLRTQQFIEFTANEIAAKEARLQQAYAAAQQPRKMLSKQAHDEFLARLMEDAQKRRATKEKLAAEKMEKELAQLKTANFKAHRPRSAR